jgi:hypothetical protein
MRKYRLVSTPPTGQGKIVTSWIGGWSNIMEVYDRYTKINPDHKFVVEVKGGGDNGK